MQYDRVLRAELMNSERWLDLSSDTARLAFVCLIPLADDFGNLEAGPRRLWRYLTLRCHLKTEADCTRVLAELMDNDMLRPYSVDGRDFWHVPRFRTDRDYIVRQVPGSPWDDARLEQRMVDLKARRRKRAVDNKGETPNVAPTLPQGSDNVAPKFRTGVGVGVGVGEEQGSLLQVAPTLPQRQRRAERLPADWTLPDDWAQWPASDPDCRAMGATVDKARKVGVRFRDYWVAKAGEKAAKLDWLGTWRNWCRSTDWHSIPETASPAQRAV